MIEAFQIRNIAVAVIVAYATTIATPMFLYAQTMESDQTAQEQQTGMPDRVDSNTVTPAELERRFNELRKETLDYRMRTVDRWLNSIAVFFTVLGTAFIIIFGGVGFFALDKLRKIEGEAQTYLDKIAIKHEEAVSAVEEIKASDVAEKPDDARKAIHSVRSNPAASPTDRIIADAVELQQRGETKEAIAKWRIIAEGTDDDDLKSRAWASVGYLEPDHAKKVSAYDRAIALDPGNAAAYNNRGIAKRNLQDYDGAVADYDRAIALKPDFADAYYSWGNVKGERKDYAGAIADYDRAIALKPDHADAYNNRGIAKRNLQDYDGAIADCGRAIALKPDYAAAYNNRGIAKRNLQDYDGAIADCGRAIALKPDYTDAYNNRGNAKSNLQDYDGAIADYDRAIALDPDNTAAYKNRGYAKLARQDYAGAIPDYDKAIALDPDNAFAHGDRGIAKRALGKHRKARADLQRALELAKEQNLEELISKIQEELQNLPSDD